MFKNRIIQIIIMGSLFTIAKVHYMPNLSWEVPIAIIVVLVLLIFMLTRAPIVAGFEQLNMDKFGFYQLEFVETYHNEKKHCFRPEKTKRDQKALALLEVRMLWNALFHPHQTGVSVFTPVPKKFTDPKEAFEFLIRECEISSVIKLEDLNTDEKKALLELATLEWHDLYGRS